MEKIYINSIAVLTSLWITNKYELLLPILILLTILMIIDYISGMLASKKEALEYLNDDKYGWNSNKSISGIYKKVGYIFLILVSVSTDFLLFKFANEIGIDFKHNTIFGLLVSIWLVINESLSILENVGRMGVKLPSFLMKTLTDLKDHINKI